MGGVTLRYPLPRTLVIVGLMGAGKTAVGRRIAARLGLPFVDADHEIEAAAGCSIEDIFARYGEPAFRDCERRVIRRLMCDPVHVLSTGGGAFMDPTTRATVATRGFSLWLRAGLDQLLARTSRRSNRPLLHTDDPRATLAQLITERHPIYAHANVVVDSGDGPLDGTVDRAMAVLNAFLEERGAQPAGTE